MPKSKKDKFVKKITYKNQMTKQTKLYKLPKNRIIFLDNFKISKLTAQKPKKLNFLKKNKLRKSNVQENKHLQTA